MLVGSVGSDLGMTPAAAADLGVRLVEVSVRPSAADLTQLAALVESGQLRVHVDNRLRLVDAAKAHELSSAGTASGKIVLVP